MSVEDWRQWCSVYWLFYVSVRSSSIIVFMIKVLAMPIFEIWGLRHQTWSLRLLYSYSYQSLHIYGSSSSSLTRYRSAGGGGNCPQPNFNALHLHKIWMACWELELASLQLHITHTVFASLSTLLSWWQRKKWMIQFIGKCLHITHGQW